MRGPLGARFTKACGNDNETFNPVGQGFVQRFLHSRGRHHEDGQIYSGLRGADAWVTWNSKYVVGGGIDWNQLTFIPALNQMLEYRMSDLCGCRDAP